jgi:UDP-galactopyranose mutase
MNVGGLAHTPAFGDWRVDPGGHRFFTREPAVLDLWNSLLPADQWISVQRSSAMLVNDHFVRYPLVGRDLLTQMGVRSGMRGLASLLRSRLQREVRPSRSPGSFRQWGTDEFGRYWYELFFDGYVRKTWQADPDDIASTWAKQRIKPIEWFPNHRRAPKEPDVFRYPRRGPGQFWEAAAGALTDAGVTISVDSTIEKIRFDGSTWTIELHNGEIASGDAVFSSMPLPLLVNSLQPKPPEQIRALAATLRHRSLITVAVAIRKFYDIPYNWIYLPSGEFWAGRIQNYRRWSQALAPADFDGTYLGFEYFIGPGGKMWTADDSTLIRCVEEDLRALGMGDSPVERVMVLRSPFAYPVSDPSQEGNVHRIRDFLRTHYPTLHPIGRNGMHRYDNQDHAMLSAIQSVDRYFGGDRDPWQVNTDRGYHESGLLKG